MNHIYPSQQRGHMVTEQNIYELKAMLEQSRHEQRASFAKLNSLNNMRSKISSSIEELSSSYKKQIKALENKVKKLETENKKLTKQNELYQIEIQNFQQRMVEKEKVISKILMKQFVIPVISREAPTSSIYRNEKWEKYEKHNLERNANQSSRQIRNTAFRNQQAHNKDSSHSNHSEQYQKSKHSNHSNDSKHNKQRLLPQQSVEQGVLQAVQPRILEQLEKQSKVLEQQSRLLPAKSYSSVKPRNFKNPSEQQIDQKGSKLVNDNEVQTVGSGETNGPQSTKCYEQTLKFDSIDQNSGQLSRQQKYPKSIMIRERGMGPKQFTRLNERTNQYSLSSQLNLQNSHLKNQASYNYQYPTQQPTQQLKSYDEYNSNFQSYQHNQKIQNYPEVHEPIQQQKTSLMQQKIPDKIKQVNIQSQLQPQMASVKRTVPPPPSAKKGPVGPKTSKPRNSKPKVLPKYKQSLQEELDHQKDQFAVQDQTTEQRDRAVRHTEGPTTKTQHQPDLQEGIHFAPPEIQGRNYHHEPINDTIQHPMYEENNQYEAGILAQNHTPNNMGRISSHDEEMLRITSQSSQSQPKNSQNRGKKGKRQNRIRQAELINFEQANLGQINFSQRDNGHQQSKQTASSFFNKLGQEKVGQHNRTINLTVHNSSNLHYNELPLSSHYQDQDHEMHGLVDESSIQQIEDMSMISNPIFPDEASQINISEHISFHNSQSVRNSHDIKLLNMKTTDGPQNNRRIDATLPSSNSIVSKKMSKKKGKRQIVEMLDPSAFI